MVRRYDTHWSPLSATHSGSGSAIASSSSSPPSYVEDEPDYEMYDYGQGQNQANKAAPTATAYPATAHMVYAPQALGSAPVQPAEQSASAPAPAPAPFDNAAAEQQAQNRIAVGRMRKRCVCEFFKGCGILFGILFLIVLAGTACYYGKLLYRAHECKKNPMAEGCEPGWERSLDLRGQ
ncbi:uncharacterized protein LTR77_007259 [Saxophila tyrrhenica]|uniref:Uncharacterized protein n=1 Tax=Saxophila tyrrhenica TaxID=1690608 RepID=A0AAV9P897_9PEZI|nr:hypothetical protein LTR77_007259 [Saxophila tyrrhenica]